MFKFFSTTEAAKKLGYSDDSVIRNMIRRKNIKVSKLAGRYILSEDDIKRLKELKKKRI